MGLPVIFTVCDEKEQRKGADGRGLKKKDEGKEKTHRGMKNASETEEGCHGNRNMAALQKP